MGRRPRQDGRVPLARVCGHGGRGDQPDDGAYRARGHSRSSLRPSLRSRGRAGRRRPVSACRGRGRGGSPWRARPALARRVRALTTQARADAIEYVHEETGFNYRLTNIQAALGVAQLEQLDGFVESKRGTAAHYREILASKPGITVLTEAPWARSTYWMTSALLFGPRPPDVRALLRELTGAGIGASPLWRPLHQQPVYKGAQSYKVEVATRLYERGLSLPCSVGITADERAAVASALAAAVTRETSQ